MPLTAQRAARLLSSGSTQHLDLRRQDLGQQLGVVNVFNFAHGSFYLLGAHFAYQVVAVAGVEFWTGVLLASLGAGAAGVLMEYLFPRRIYGRAGEAGFQILLTYSFILILDDVVKMLWGTDYKSISKPEALAGPLSVGAVTMPRYDLVVIVVGLAVAVGMWAAIKKTRFGRNLRAISSNREMASSLGLNVPLTLSLVFGLATAMGGLSGALSAPVRTVTPGAQARFRGRRRQRHLQSAGSLVGHGHALSGRRRSDRKAARTGIKSRSER